MALTKVKLIADGTIVQSHLNASHGITTADIGEGSNLYYTDARARAAVSVSGNALSYNSSTGVITSNFEESPVFTGTVKASTYLINTTSAAGIGTSLGDINGAELGPGYLIVSRDDTASAKQISFYKNNVEHSYLETTSSGLNIGGTNVGIGVSPYSFSQLHIYDTSDVFLTLQKGTANGYIINDGTNISLASDQGTTGKKLLVNRSAPDSSLVIDSSGKVLINQTSSATTAHLQVDGYVDITKNPVGAFRLYDGTTFKGGLGDGQWAFGSTSNVNDFALYAQNDLLFHAGTGNSIDMMIDATTHNVGIGNTVASAIDSASGLGTLVVGDGGASSQGITIYTGTATYGALNFADATSGTGAYQGYIKFDHTGNSFGHYIGNVERMKVDSNGWSYFNNNNTGGGIEINGTSGNYIDFYINSSNTSFTTNAPNGFYFSKKIGIENTSPNATLEIGTPGGAFAGSPGSVDRLFIAPYSNTGGPYKFIGRTVSGSSDFLDMYYGSNHIISYGLDGKIGIGTTSPSKLLTVGSATSSSGIFNDGIFVNINGGAAITTKSGTSGVEVQMNAEGSIGTIGTFSNHDLSVRTNNGEKMRIKSGGNILMGITTEQNAGKVQIQSGGSENGGILDIVGSGWYRYYTRVCHNATSAQQAGYWHIKTNIAANSNTMFLAKFYGYIYGTGQILDLTHVGYAYSATSSVINQGTTNNGSDPNASSAVYISANGSKVTFRIAFGSGSNFSTYFAGVFMDIAFPSPAGQGHDFEIEAQTFSTSTTVY